MECSNAMAKNSITGIHIAMTFPPTVVEIIVPTTPSETIQLHNYRAQTGPASEVVPQPIDY